MCLSEAAKKAWPLKKELFLQLFFLFCSKSEIKHILFQGLLIRRHINTQVYTLFFDKFVAVFGRKYGSISPKKENFFPAYLTQTQWERGGENRLKSRGTTTEEVSIWQHSAPDPQLPPLPHAHMSKLFSYRMSRKSCPILIV